MKRQMLHNWYVWLMEKKHNFTKDFYVPCHAARERWSQNNIVLSGDKEYIN